MTGRPRRRWRTTRRIVDALAAGDGAAAEAAMRQLLTVHPEVERRGARAARALTATAGGAAEACRPAPGGMRPTGEPPPVGPRRIPT